MTNTATLTFWSWAGKSANALSPFVPLWQTLAWVILIAGLVFAFRKHLYDLAEAIRKRVERGSALKAGPFELGGDLQKMDDIGAKTNSAPIAETSWEEERNAMYQDSRGLFLSHVLSPSDDPEQEFDIFVFLVRHKQKGFADLEYAEFFLGQHWGNKVFREQAVDDTLGIRVSAYGPFLCVCKLTFHDGHKATITRYVDFEMGKMMKDRRRGWRLRR